MSGVTATNTETALPEQLAAYVDARRVLLGLPAAEDLPCVTPVTDAEATYPSIYITAAQIDSPHPRRLTLAVIVELQTQMESTTVEQEDAWLALLRRLLNDASAFRFWLGSRSGEDRPGFDLRKMRISGISTAVAAEKKMRGRRTDLIVHVRAHELAPMPAAA